MKFSLSRLITTFAFSLVLLSVAGTVKAGEIVTRYYNFDEGGGASSGGVVTFTDLGLLTPNTLEILIDNTSTGGVSSIITGLVFDIVADIDAFSWVFEDGGGNDLASVWEILIDKDSNITPGNTKVDITFRSINGINGGLYNFDADPPGNTSNAFPDVGKLVLTITDPEEWFLSPGGISGDILRMQRTGLNGQGSLKLPGGDDPDNPDPPIPEVPVPGTILLIGLGLMGLRLARRLAL